MSFRVTTGESQSLSCEKQIHQPRENPNLSVVKNKSTNQGRIHQSLILVGGLEHGCYDFPYLGNVVTPTDCHIFQRGRAQPPTRYKHIYIFNIICYNPIIKPYVTTIVGIITTIFRGVSYQVEVSHCHPERPRWFFTNSANLLEVMATSKPANLSIEIY